MNRGWDNILAHEVRAGDRIAAVQAKGQGVWQGTVEFVDTKTETGAVRFRFTDDKYSAWYSANGTLARYYE